MISALRQFAVLRESGDTQLPRCFTRLVDLVSIVFCSGYYLDGGKQGQITGACLSDVSSGYKGTWAYTNGGSSWTVTTSTLTVSSSTVGAIGIVGWNIKEPASSTGTGTSTRDLVSSGHSFSPTPASSATEAKASTATSTTPSSQASNLSATGGLSTGATIGVGLGVALGVIGVVSLVVAVCLMRRKRQKKATTLERRPTPPLQQMMDFKPAAGLGPWGSQELGADSSRQRSELYSGDAFRHPVELAG